ncbi:MAG: hypothetical protein ACJATV_000941 [Granulosicoccus sp.]|jgi:hypothetical protein
MKSQFVTLRASLLAAAVGLTCTPIFANDGTNDQERLENTEQRIQYLEQLMQDQNKTIATKQTKGENWSENLSFGGVIEVEGGVSDIDNAESTSDIVVATVELAAEAAISDQLRVNIVLLYEENESGIDVDVAEFRYQLDNSGWFVGAGQHYVPFGTYETSLVSAPLTLELGETSETTVTIGYEDDNVSAGFYVFNGTNKKNGSEKINNWGTNIAYSGDIVSFGAGYINDLADSDTIEGALGSNNVSNYVDGATASLIINAGDITLIAEQLSALNTFTSAPVSGDKPSARNLEINYAFHISGKPTTFAVAFQGTDEASALELPETKNLVGLSVEISDNLGLGFEISQEDDYNDVSTTSFVAQVAVSF